MSAELSRLLTAHVERSRDTVGTSQWCLDFARHEAGTGAAPNLAPSSGTSASASSAATASGWSDRTGRARRRCSSCRPAEIEPDSGKVIRAKTLEGIVIDQQRKLLSPEKRVRDIIADGGDWVEVRGEKKHIKGYLKDFLFDPNMSEARVGTLSGRRAIAAAAGARICPRIPICWCSTNRPTISTLKRSTCCRR